MVAMQPVDGLDAGTAARPAPSAMPSRGAPTAPSRRATGATSTPTSFATPFERRRGATRTGPGTVVTRFGLSGPLPTRIGAPHARRPGAPPPTWLSQRRSAALRPPITRPSMLRSASIGLHHGPLAPAHPGVPPSGLRSAPQSPRRRRAPIRPGTPGTHPATTRSVPRGGRAPGPLRRAPGWTDCAQASREGNLKFENQRAGDDSLPGSPDVRGSGSGSSKESLLAAL